MASPVSTNDAHPRVRDGERVPSTPPSAGVPDLAAVAGEAVIRFLHDSAVATAEREGTRQAGAVPGEMATSAVRAGSAAGDGQREADVSVATVNEAMPWSAASDANNLSADSMALKAAAVSVATLDRIEVMAAKLELDIASAVRVQAELQAGAGAAAEAAVRAAQDAWEAAGTAVQADARAKISLLKVARYVEVTVVLLVIAMVVLVVTATTVH